MMRATAVLLLLALLLTTGTASALSLPFVPNICSSLFSSSSPMPLHGAAGYFGTVAGIAFLVVLVVLMVLGLAYAIGYAFGISSLLNFVKAESVESFFNMLLIALVAFGIGFAGPAMQFLAGIGGIGLESVGAAAPNIASAQGLYTSLCTHYVTHGIGTIIDNSVTLSITYIFTSVLQQTRVQLMPNGFGFSWFPFAGAAIQLNVINMQMQVYTFLAAIFVAMAILLALIYFLFPIFLYAGVLLRAFPWTRAAGGSLIALFVAFYIVFPALLYPFSTYLTLAIDKASSAIPPLSSLSSLSLPVSVLSSSVNGAAVADEVMGVGGFAQNLAYMALQIIGVFVAFLVSFDLLEALGDLLGSPSLRADRLFSKVI